MTDQTDPIPALSRDDPAAHSGDVVGENIAALKVLFPQIITDGKVDFEVLRQLLGDAVEEGEERYGLTWKGKAKARAFALTPTLATLRPVKDDSVDWEATQNLMIEGDNLEVLKCLRKAYAGKIKLIYIDPPYNTGKDFVYPDNYTDSVQNYLRLTGQLGQDGIMQVSNRDGSGRFHTDWLNMIYPRLMIAKELLSEDGAILVSIDDAELANLTNLCREWFGEDCFVTSFVRRRRMSSGMRDSALSPDHEYVAVIARNALKMKVFGFARDPEDFPYQDSKSRYRSTDLTVGMDRSQRPNQFFEISNPRTGKGFWPSDNRVWRFEPGSMQREIDAENIIWPDDLPDGSMSRPRYKTRWRPDEENENPVSTWIERASATSDREGKCIVSGLNEEATRQVRDLFGEQVFDYPKPISLLAGLIRAFAGPQEGTIVLDFFAGSGTTGHAVMAQNAVDGGKRRFVLIQLPEPLDPARREQKTAADFCDKLGKPRNIAELTKERLRRAGVKVKADHPDSNVDIGFRVYRLDSSNLKPWQPYASNLEASLLDSVSNILPGRSEDDLLVELLLKTGIDPSTPEEIKAIAGKSVHALGGGTLMVCLADIEDADAETLGHGLADWQAELDPAGQTTFYFKDEGFASACAKANLAAILRQRLGDKIAKLASI